MDTEPLWYTKWVVGVEEDKCKCPACGGGFPIDLAFDNAPRWCPSCKKEMVHWNFYSLVLTIDPEKAPPLVKAVIDFIRPMSDFDSEEAMKQLYQLFDRKSP